MSDVLDWFVSCPRGLEPLLAEELLGLGASEALERAGGVACRGPRDLAYRACLWSRLASRVLLPLTRFELADADDLYAGALAVDWPDHFSPDSSFAIEVAGHSAAVTHTHYAGLKVKDAIADAFRERCGRRPNVDTDSPSIRVHLHLGRDGATVSLDLSGDSLHRRGYRGGTGEAPLKENLACALLLRAGWPQIAAAGGALIDPMCGSGTLLIEGAWMAGDVAPALSRHRFGFEAWLDHVPAAWNALKREAQSRRDLGLKRLPPLLGRDLDPVVLGHARRNALNAGLGDAITWEAGDLLQARPCGQVPGLLLTNPPYGERLSGVGTGSTFTRRAQKTPDRAAPAAGPSRSATPSRRAEGEVIKLHTLLGATLKQHFGGWRAAVLTARPDLGPRIGLRADAIHAFYNGDLPCKLLQFAIAAPAVAAPAAGAATGMAPANDDSAFANRLAKNRRHLGKWARRSGVDCYRLYDADLPDYALAVDLYTAADPHLHVQEYAAPRDVDPVKAEKRLREALSHLQAAFDLPSPRLHFKQRSVQHGSAQYEKQGENLRVLEVQEHGCRLLVNLDDYLDTGLFLDHRALRRRLQQEAANRSLLNLFCYTGAASVHAALGGALQTVSVDLSNTYLRWAQRNFRLNGFDAVIIDGRDAPSAAAVGTPGGPWQRSTARRPSAPMPASRHTLVRDDCMAWLARSAADPSRRFDLIFCDPPTFSNSARLVDVFDVQRDHLELIGRARALLAPGGVLYFSTNRRKFKLDPAAVEGAHCVDITAQTLDEDFKRPPPAHRCWRITHPQPGAQG